MKYEVQVKNPLMVSVKKFVNADSEISAKNKARKIFTFKGPDKYILVKKVK